ncbi:MAG: formylglycine-generating enzyme family protein [Acidobacteriota bacterium]
MIVFLFGLTIGLQLPTLAVVLPQKGFETKEGEQSTGKKLDDPEVNKTDKVDKTEEKRQVTPANNAINNKRVKPSNVEKARKAFKSESPRPEPPKVEVTNSTALERAKPNRKVEPPKSEPSKEDLPLADAGSQYPDMVSIPAGTFEMGSENGQANETPVHGIKLSAFEISKYEITNYQFRTFIKATNYKTLAEREKKKFTWETYGERGREKYPVVMVAWEDAMEYCQWLSKQTGETYRLPSEAQWEYAARGGSVGKAYPWGDELEVSKANFAADSSRLSYAEPVLEFIRPVGSYEPNSFGLYDVIGNVWEWCYDWYKDDYYDESPAQNPLGPEDGKLRITRGGGWGHSSLFCRVSLRKPTHPSFKSSSIGFRVVKVKLESASSQIKEE